MGMMGGKENGQTGKWEGKYESEEFQTNDFISLKRGAIMNNNN
jgi:hypothetical protein